MSSVPAMRVWQARRDLEPTPTMLSSFSFSSGLIRDRFLRPDGDAIGDRRTQQLLHRADFEHVANQAAVLHIPFQQSLALPESD